MLEHTSVSSLFVHPTRGSFDTTDAFETHWTTALFKVQKALAGG